MKLSKLKAVLLAVIVLPWFGACANQGGTKSASEGECPPGRTMMCEERIGEVQECNCLLKADMEELFDLRPERY